MVASHRRRVISLLTIFLFSIARIAALTGTVEPYPVGSCDNALLTGAYKCPSGNGCCVGACCAGGCCPSTATCVAQGTSDEACCPLLSSDTTLCGTATSSGGGSSGGGSGVPVYCYAGGQDFTCPPGAICGAVYKSCIGGSWAGGSGGSGSSSGSGSGSSSSSSSTTDSGSGSSSTTIPTSTSGAASSATTTTKASLAPRAINEKMASLLLGLMIVNTVALMVL